MEGNNEFIKALNCLLQGGPGILVDQLHALYCKINRLDPDETFAAFETLITARELYELRDCRLTPEEELFFQGMKRALRLQMIALCKQDPENEAINKKRDLMHAGRYGFTCRKDR